jgi:hypothetical protein
MENNASSQRFGIGIMRRGVKTMLSIATHSPRWRHDPASRGFHAVYRQDEVNHCPGCGRTHWYVGRMSAECGFCGTALALAETGMTGAGLFLHRTQLDEAA